SAICFAIRWDPTRTTINPDNEPDAPHFGEDARVTSTFLEPAIEKTQR
ncbi:hypothetical protein H3280_27410, partial [Escherichia coli]|nr:hypothetical protein [Escherichia coli]